MITLMLLLLPALLAELTLKSIHYVDKHADRENFNFGEDQFF